MVKLEQNLWVIRGRVPGAPLTRWMTLARLADGRLVVHGAMALEEPLMAEIEAFGRPAFLVVPNGFHRLDAHAWKTRYPEMTVLCPALSAGKVAQLVPVDGHYDAFPSDPDVRLETLEGTKEGVLHVRSAGRVSLAFTDAIFNMPHAGGFNGFVLRIIGSSGGPKVTPIFRMAGMTSRPPFRAHLERLANTPGLTRLVVAHGDLIEDRASEILKQVAARL